MPSRDVVSSGTLKATATINLLAGIWLFISPWVYRAYDIPNAWNSWIVGGLIAILAAIHLGNPVSGRFLSYINMVLAAWTFASPWIYGYYGDTPRFINSLCVGVIVFICAASAASAHVDHTSTIHTEPPAVRP